MITDAGEVVLAQFFAGEIESWAGSIAIGVGETNELATDTALEFELMRAPVDFIEAGDGIVTPRAIFETLPLGEVYEAGIFLSTAGAEGELYTKFDNSAEIISSNGVVVTSRVGARSLSIPVSPSVTETVDITTASSISGVDDADLFKLAYDATDIDTITVFFMEDESNYLSYSFSPASGHNVESFAKSALATTGSPDEDNIRTIRIEIDSASNGTCILDGLRSDEPNTLVARVVNQGTGFTKPQQDFQSEHELPVTFS